MKIRYMNPVCTWEDVQNMTKAAELVARVLEHLQIGDREDASPELMKTRELFLAMLYDWRRHIDPPTYVEPEKDRAALKQHNTPGND